MPANRLITLTSRVRRSGDNGEALRAALKRAGDAMVAVGVVKEAGQYKAQEPKPRKDGKPGRSPAPPPTVEQVATWMEFGTETVPERSFLRRTLYEKLGALNALRREQLLAVAFEKRNPKTALATIGLQFSEMIKNTIKSGVGPPLNSGYKAWKKRQGLRTGTLRATDLLLRSIGFKVTGGGPGGH